jgi:hypothetical protein
MSFMVSTSCDTWKSACRHLVRCIQHLTKCMRHLVRCIRHFVTLATLKCGILRETIPPRRYDSYVALISSICEPPSFSKVVRCDTFMDEDVEIDYMFATNGIIIEYMDTVDGFS